VEVFSKVLKTSVEKFAKNGIEEQPQNLSEIIVIKKISLKPNRFNSSISK